jgi:hypothetical protein
LRGKLTTERFCFGKVRFGEEILGIEAMRERERNENEKENWENVIVSVVAAE